MLTKNKFHQIQCPHLLARTSVGLHIFNVGDFLILVTVWWLIRNIIRTVYTVANVLRHTRTASIVTAKKQFIQLGSALIFLCFFTLHDLSACFRVYCFTLEVESFLSHWCNKRKWAPIEFFASSARVWNSLPSASTLSAPCGFVSKHTIIILLSIVLLFVPAKWLRHFG